MENLKEQFESEGIGRYSCQHPDYPRWTTREELVFDDIVWYILMAILLVLLLSLTIGEYLFRNV